MHKVSMGSAWSDWSWRPSASTTKKGKKKGPKKGTALHKQLCILKTGAVVYRTLRAYRTPNGERARGAAGELFRRGYYMGVPAWVQAGMDKKLEAQHVQYTSN